MPSPIAFQILILFIASVYGREQVPLHVFEGDPRMPKDTIVRHCPESGPDDLLHITRMIDDPLDWYIDNVQSIFIWGDFFRAVSPNSTVDYQINVTANTGDQGALNGTYHICDALEQMHQPPEYNLSKPNSCPPEEGPVFIEFCFWFARWLVAPGLWSAKFDAKTPEGDRIYCLEAEWSLQCAPWDDDYRCLRGDPDILDPPVLSKAGERRLADERKFPFSLPGGPVQGVSSGPWPLVA